MTEPTSGEGSVESVRLLTMPKTRRVALETRRDLEAHAERFSSVAGAARRLQ